MQKADKGFSPPCPFPTLCRLVYLCTCTCTPCGPGIVCPYLLCFAAALPLWDRIHAQIIHSVKSQFTCTHPQCALVSGGDLRGRHNLVNVWMGNQRRPTTRSRVIHCGPKALQGVHPQLKLDQGMKIIMFWEMISLSLTFLTFDIAEQSYQMNV